MKTKQKKQSPEDNVDVLEIKLERIPIENIAEVLRRRDLPDHVFEHLLTMARLHAANRYDRLTHDVEAITERPATSTPIR